MALAQGDGFALNTVTLGIVTAIVLGLAGAITFLFKLVTSGQQRQIDKLTEERDLLLDKLLHTMRTADRAGEAADEAARMLTSDRRAPRKR
jgi:hypothetical protein